MSPRWSRRPGPYEQYPYGYQRRPRGGSCLRDTCLLETGCCLGEAIDGSCLMLGVLLLPRLLVTLVSAPSKAGTADGPLVGAIRTYQQRISANRAPCCRFTPSCSHYAAEAITTHGARRGLALAARRLLRCRPNGRRGPDPVPPRTADPVARSLRIQADGSGAQLP